MSDTSRSFRRRLLPALCSLALLGACGDDLTLPPAQVFIAEQDINLFALSGTPVRTPSAYTMLNLRSVRTDLTNDFDFAFDIRDTLGGTQAYLIPRAVLGFQPDGGLQHTTLPFDSVLLAPTGGYEREKMVPVQEGDVLIVASRLQNCEFGIVSPRYAKLLIQEIDLTERRAAIRVVIDPNCGYRSLGSGIPTQ